MNVFNLDCRNGFFATPVLRMWDDASGSCWYKNTHGMQTVSALRKIRQWKILISAELWMRNETPDTSFVLFCGEICVVPLVTLEVSIIWRGNHVPHDRSFFGISTNQKTKQKEQLELL